MFLLLTILGTAVVIGLASISIVANFWFGTLLTSGEERFFYGALFACLDSLKTLLVPIAALAWLSGLFAKARAAVLVFVLLSALSFTAEIGLYATTKSETVGDAKAVHERYRQAKATKKKADADLAAMGHTRPVGKIEGELAVLRRDHRFDRSKQCANATALDSRQLCAQIDVLAGELKTALEVAHLRLVAAGAALTLDKQDVAAAMRKIDPQAEALAKMLGVFIVVDAETVRTGLAVFIALLIELGSGLGPWLVMPAHKRPLDGSRKPGHSQTISQHDDMKASSVPHAGRAVESPRDIPAISIDQDAVIRWASEAIIKRRGSFVPAKEARTAFDAWCAEAGTLPLNATAFGKAMTKLGFARRKQGGMQRYEGIALTSSQPDNPIRLAVDNARMSA